MRRLAPFFCALALAGCVQAPPSPPPPQPLAETLSAAPAFSTFSAALAATGIDPAADGPVTLFVPDDRAFARLPAQARDTLLAPGNRAALARILDMHIVPGRVSGRDMLDRTRTLTTRAGNEIEVIGSRPIRVDNAVLLAIDIPATDGVIHVIDRVLLP